ncbi:hypothetical protein [Paenibacillus abyssi]|uniref:Uncharacterized protein n=1 Tax=Paenibacillus abyssi TaxID=1340531 RepID=A0A917FMN7_9BACL|nr:hypothetical protein [Paenibacillus abyssi]GGF92987.1 hypothetical protein GCM10010916_07930 [Paenibacillus abyssi]
MPRKVNKLVQYPFQIELHVTQVETREGKGVVIDRHGEWIQVFLPTRNKVVKTSLFLVEKLL